MRRRISIRGYVRPLVPHTLKTWNHAKVPFLTITTTSSTSTSGNANYAVYPALFLLNDERETFYIPNTPKKVPTSDSMCVFQLDMEFSRLDMDAELFFFAFGLHNFYQIGDRSQRYGPEKCS